MLVFDDQVAQERTALLRDTVLLVAVPNNDHGCRGYWVRVRPLNDEEGIIIEGAGCSSAWAVGHNDSASPIPAGTQVRLPVGVQSWAEASEYVGYSHNAGVDDADDPRPDSTLVGPDDLVIA